MSKFLDDLKNAADTGEFNSDAAKKINAVNEMADGKSNLMTNEQLQNSLNERIGNKPLNGVSEEQALELNSKYEEEMKRLKDIDSVNSQLANLIEIEDMVKASIDDMIGHVAELEEVHGKDFEGKVNPIFIPLIEKIEEINSKY